MKGINWAGAIIAAIVSFLLGFLWYGILFAEQWMALHQVTPTQEAANAAMGFGFLNQLVVALGLSWLVKRSGAATLSGGAITGLGAGLFFACTTSALNFIYGEFDPALLPLDFSYLLLSYTAMGAVVGAVKLGSRNAAAA